MGDSLYAFSDEEEDFCLTYGRHFNVEERGEKWKKYESKYHHTAHSIMSSFLTMASSIKEVVWHFWLPQEGAPSSCWIWRRAKTRGGIEKNMNVMKWSRGNRLKVEVETGRSILVVGDLMALGAIRHPERFTFTVGREAEYLKTFEYRR